MSVSRDLFIDGEPFDDLDGFLDDHEESLSATDKALIDDLLHGRAASGYIGGSYGVPVFYLCVSGSAADPDQGCHYDSTAESE